MFLTQLLLKMHMLSIYGLFFYKPYLYMPEHCSQTCVITLQGKDMAIIQTSSVKNLQ